MVVPMEQRLAAMLAWTKVATTAEKWDDYLAAWLEQRSELQKVAETERRLVEKSVR